MEERNMKDNIKVLISQEDLENRIKEMAEQINKDYEGEALHLICILRGSVFFTCELAKHLTMPVTIDFMTASSYRDQMESQGFVDIMQELTDSIEDRNVLVIEDIIDSGNTLSCLLPIFQEKHPKSLKLCTLLDKPDRRVVDVKVDYVGMQIPDLFVVGYGLDFAQKYRNLPYIGVIQQ